MIFMTPKTSNRPAATTYKMAAVLTMSRSCATIRRDFFNRDSGISFCLAASRPERRDASHHLIELRTLTARVHVLEGRHDVDSAIGLDLAEIHGERRMTLLVHLDQAARSLEADILQRRQHRLGVDGSGFFNGKRVKMDRLVLW